MIIIMRIIFVACWTYEQPAILFPAGGRPHHRDFPTRQGGNQSPMVETAIRSASTTPRRNYNVVLQHSE